MCLSPQRIRNNSCYKNADFSQAFYEVPCGKCDECRHLHQLEWETRISFEMKSYQKRGGQFIFLTFTYNNENLPHYKDIEAGFEFDCFNKNHVLRFLNRLKVTIYRLFGAGSYKYFFASEYGKDTQRPHYHCLFFLESYVDAHLFAETCRDLWSYGFMFPKYDSFRKMYVDSYNRSSTIFIKSAIAGAHYVTKYICKDLSYFNHPDVVLYLADDKHKESMKDYLPKHYQSKKLGYSIFDGIKDSDFEKLLSNGVYNPLFCKQVPLPQYCINKMMYKNVSTLGTPYERFGKSGKVLYDRELTDFGIKYYKMVYDYKITRQTDKFFKFFSESISIPSDVLKSLRQLSIDIHDFDSLRPLARHHLFLKMMGNRPLSYHSIVDKSYYDIVTNDDLCYNIYYSSRVLTFLRSLPYFTEPDLDFTFRDKTFKLFDIIENYYVSETIIRKEEEYKKRKEEYEKLQRYNREYKHFFDKSLC